MDMWQTVAITTLNQAAEYAVVEGKTEVEAYLDGQVEDGFISRELADKITKALKIIFKEEME